MDTWVELEEFAKISGLPKEKVLELVANGSLKSKQESDKFFIEASTSASAVVPVKNSSVTETESNTEFMEKTIGTILSLHEKVLSSKEETISSIKNENQFLKDALFSTQDIADDDKKTIATLREQLRIAQEEIDFLKRKYRLMWGKVIDRKSQGSTEG